MEMLESIAVHIAFGDEKFCCPFPHEPMVHKKENKIPPDHKNSSGVLGENLKGESNRLETLPIKPPFSRKGGKKCMEAGFSPHHLMPGNEMWNDKGHPLHSWIHKSVENKVKGDIGYVNNAAYNGFDLPGHHKFDDWSEASDDQAGYAFASMKADPKMRQFHDAHKAYSDMVWNALEKISAKLDKIAERKGCGKKNCPAAKSKPYDPPYGVLEQLLGVASRLREKVRGTPKKWQAPVMTSRFALMYSMGGEDQEEARRTLAELRDEMGRPTDQDD